MRCDLRGCTGMARKVEEPEYDVLVRHGEFEVRRYSDMIQARLSVDRNNEFKPSHSFRRIAGYIFGGNANSTRIPMTSPVQIWHSGTYSTMAFTMPSFLSEEDLPHPNDEDIRITAVPAGEVAAIKFSGFSNRSKVSRLMQKIIHLTEKKGYIGRNEPILAIYDNPSTTIPFLRRNEILLPLENTGGGTIE